jgi:transcriptional regulator with XRE-family HTH domain
MSITTAQIRGARGILNWSQQDLAQRTGISATSIGSIENGTTTPRASTLETIRKAFENGGIDFIGLEGVRQKSGDVRIYRGRDGFIEFYDDIYNTIRDHKEDILVSNVDERLFVKILGDYAKIHVDRIKALKSVHYKILVREGDNYIPGSDYAEYRWVSKDLFASVPFYVYGEKLAIMLFESEPSVIVLNYPSIAYAYRVQFADMWERSKQVETKEIVKEL